MFGIFQDLKIFPRLCSARFTSTWTLPFFCFYFLLIFLFVKIIILMDLSYENSSYELQILIPDSGMMRLKEEPPKTRERHWEPERASENNWDPRRSTEERLNEKNVPFVQRNIFLWFILKFFFTIVMISSLLVARPILHLLLLMHFWDLLLKYLVLTKKCTVLCHLLMSK